MKMRCKSMTIWDSSSDTWLKYGNVDLKVVIDWQNKTTWSNQIPIKVRPH